MMVEEEEEVGVYGEADFNAIVEEVKISNAEKVLAMITQFDNLSEDVMKASIPVLLERFPNEAVFDANKANIKLFMRKGFKKDERKVFQVCEEFENKHVFSDTIKEMRKKRNILDMRLNRIFAKIKANLYGKPFEPVEL